LGSHFSSRTAKYAKRLYKSIKIWRASILEEIRLSPPLNFHGLHITYTKVTFKSVTGVASSKDNLTKRIPSLLFYKFGTQSILDEVIKRVKTIAHGN
jgi:hypothetical protein